MVLHHSSLTRMRHTAEELSDFFINIARNLFGIMSGSGMPIEFLLGLFPRLKECSWPTTSARTGAMEGTYSRTVQHASKGPPCTRPATTQGSVLRRPQLPDRADERNVGQIDVPDGGLGGVIRCLVNCAVLRLEAM